MKKGESNHKIRQLFQPVYKNLHTLIRLLYMDNNSCLPFVLKTATMKVFHETHPDQFGKKIFSKYVKWPNINKMIYFYGNNCSDCIKAGENINPWSQKNIIASFPTFIYKWRNQVSFCMHIRFIVGHWEDTVLCIDGFSNFPSAKITSITSAGNVIDFLTDWTHLHGQPNSIRNDHASCFIGTIFKSYSNSNKIENISCTKADHRSKRLVDKLVLTVKSKWQTMSSELLKPSLLDSVSKMIWNLRSKKHSIKV